MISLLGRVSERVSFYLSRHEILKNVKRLTIKQGKV
jgi:hypothetical protein